MNRSLESAGLVLLVVVGLSLSRAAEPPAAFETPAQNLDRDLKPIRAHVQSMKARMERGISSVGVGEADDDALAVQGFASRCCTKSIRIVHTLMTSLEKRALALGKRYQAEDRADGAGLAGEIASDAVSARKRLELFAAAPDRTSALAALQNVVTGVINLNIDRRDLEACCNDLQVPVPADEPPNP